MIDGRKEERCEAVRQEAGQDEPSSLPNLSELLPYHPPQLRRLGSVRELTLGTGSNLPDAIENTFFD